MTDPQAVSATSSDADLISAVRAGDAGAYGILYERHSGPALRLARAITPGEADADDVVAETFAKVLAAIRRGAGPSVAFRPYLLTAIRRVAYDQVRAQRSQIPTDDADLADPGEPFVDPAEASLERSLIARAFEALPERWAAVLWHTEIEQARPAEVALLLGISPNSVAALRYRAREGLRQAYLQMHLSGARPDCQPSAGKLGAYVRGALARRAAKQVAGHLSQCAYCTAAHAELVAINAAMRGMLAPVLLGGQAAAYLARGAHGSVPALAGRVSAAVRGLQRLPWHRAAVQVAAGAGVVAIAATVTLVHPHLASPGTQGLPRVGPAGAAGPVSRVSSTAARSGKARPGQPAPVPAPTRSGTTSPGPSPPGPSPTGLPSPAPTGTRAAARLSVNVAVNGLLSLGVVDVVAIDVSDPGTAATAGLTASLVLPAGVTLLGLAAGSSGWTCSGSTCTHPSIGAGAATRVSFRILVASLAGCGSPVAATVVSGALSASGQSAEQVQCAALARPAVVWAPIRAARDLRDTA